MSGISGIDHFIRLNQEHSSLYTSPAIVLERQHYRREHRTAIAAMKCMDGRLHLPIITKTALGVIEPWRNYGGRFDLGWPAYQQSMSRWVSQSASKGRHCLPIVTYHFARGSVERGCRAFHGIAEDARQSANALKRQFDRSFIGQKSVHTVLCGIETDQDALVLHGEHEKVADLATHSDTSEDGLKYLLREFYPKMPGPIKRDFLPLLIGNVAHMAEVRKSQRPIQDVEHKEWALGIGLGFDWLHEINTALIIGPFDPNLDAAILTGARLLYENMRAGRTDSSRGIVLMASAPYHNPKGDEPLLAKEQAFFLRDFALKVIRDEVRDLMPFIHQVTGTVDMKTRKFNVLDRS